MPDQRVMRVHPVMQLIGRPGQSVCLPRVAVQDDARDIQQDGARDAQGFGQFHRFE